MSNRRKIRAQAQAEVAIMPGACLDDERSIAAMKQRTHDGLIKRLGPLRLSGIWWLPFRGRDECREALQSLYPPEPADDPVARAGLDQYYAFFDEHADRCVLIVACCDALRPP